MTADQMFGICNLSVLAVWVPYRAFDLFIGSWKVRDTDHRQEHVKC
jgi:hypothetical protein